jgi:hypothetical protein
MALSKKQLEQLKSLLAKQRRDAEAAKKQSGTSTAPLFSGIGNPDFKGKAISLGDDDWMQQMRKTPAADSDADTE